MFWMNYLLIMCKTQEAKAADVRERKTAWKLLVIERRTCDSSQVTTMSYGLQKN